MSWDYVKYSEYISKLGLKTGDLLIFQGAGPAAKNVQAWTLSEFSHVAIVYECPITKQLYSWEIGDIDKGSGPIITKENCSVDMAHMAPLEPKFFRGNRTGRVWVRRLKNRQNKDVDHFTFTKFLAKYIGIEYDYNLVLHWVKRFRISLFLDFNVLDDLSLNVYEECWTCPTLVLKTYEALGVMKLNHQFYFPSVYPKDFVLKTKRRQIYEMINGFYFDKLELIVDKLQNKVVI